MPFTPKTFPCRGRINPVTLGAGENAIVLGGQNVLPFYTFDGPVENPPRIGVEVSTAEWDVPGLAAFYAGCDTFAQKAQRAATIEGVDFLALNFTCADPNGENRPVEDCVRDAVAIAGAVEKPLVILGCKHQEKDTALFAAMAQALEGKNVLFMAAKLENCQAVGQVVSKYGHKTGAETADDINLAKQLNIVLRKDAGVPEENIVMNIGTAPVGYGFEYVVSTVDRIRDAALNQCDTDLQMPILAPVSGDAWGVKESTATQEDEPAWGDREERGIHMEIVTAAASLTCGADGVILRHPEAIATVREFICGLLGGQ